jgi:hypothetical protein
VLGGRVGGCVGGVSVRGYGLQLTIRRQRKGRWAGIAGVKRVDA